MLNQFSKLFLKVYCSIMSNSSYNFKDNLTIDNNKYLKWLDSTGTSRANIIGVDTNNDLHIRPVHINGDVFLNSVTTGSSRTIINANGNTGDVIVATKLGVGINNSSTVTANITLVKNGYIGTDSSTGSYNSYLGIASGNVLSNTTGSRIVVHGNDHGTYPGHLHMYSGNVANGHLNFYTGDDSLRIQVLNSGTTSFLPNGVTSRLVIAEQNITVTNDLVVSSTTQSYNASTGALQIQGGIGIKGNLYVDGTINLSNATGNINFDSTQTSTSYTSGAIFISGGLGISTTVNASSKTAGGALSIAGGAAIGKDVYIGGRLVIDDTTIPTNSQSGSIVSYGGMGLNGPILLRADQSSQIRLAPMTDGVETSITFYSRNNFSIGSGVDSIWRIGQNVNTVGSATFAIYNSDFGNVLTIDQTGQTRIQCTTNSVGIGSGGSVTVAGGMAIAKDLYIGGTLTANGIAFGENTSYAFSQVSVTSTANATGVGSGGSLTVAGGASIAKDMYIGGSVLQIPSGTTLQRPVSANSGTIRYNTETSQFEGYGPGNWGSLGGTIDIAQTTKILASATPNITDGNLYFYTVNAERMRINSAGNIGIGTTSPQYKLDINGSIGISGDLVAVSQTNTIGNLFTDNNNVGIGTIDPQYALDVSGDLRVTADLYILGSINAESASASTFSYLTLTATDQSVNLSTGSFVTLGGVTIKTTADAMSVTNGGSFTVAGGASIAKNLIVGNTITSTNATFGNVTSTNSTLGNVVSTGLTTGNINFTGLLYQNGQLYLGSQWTTTSGNVSYTSGDVIASGYSGGSIAISETAAIGSTANATGVGSGGSLTVAGGASIAKDVYVGGIMTSSSDIRLKTNIEPLRNGDESLLDKLAHVRTIRYNYLHDPESPDRHVGFVAQDFVNVFPELLRQHTDESFYSFDYQRMTVVLLECIRELQTRIQQLENNQ